MDTVASHGQCCAKVSLGHPFPTPTLQKRHALGRKRVPLRRRVVRLHAVRIYSQAGFGRGTVKFKEEEGESETTESEPSSGTKKLFKFPMPSKLPGTVKLQNKSQSQAKSNKVIFVAGATGKVGSRTVRELLKLGLSVRASTRNVEKAQALFEDVASLSADAAGSDDSALFGFFSPAKLFGFLKPKAGKRLEIVECNLEDPESIEPALGNAGVVVCCIGASEKEVLDVTGPYRIDFKATENLINAASSAEVNHFVLLTSLGTQKFGFPAAVLNLFWGVLLWKAKAEKALIQSGLPYTIVRPGGMERPTDAYKETHNLLLSEADKLFGGQVSNLQVAELLASIVENPDVSVNKIVEAIAETTAPLRPIKDLLEEIPAKDISSPEPQSLKPAKADVDAQKSFKKQGEERNNRALALKEREEKRIQAEKLEEEKRAQAQKGKEEKRIQAERDEKEKQRLQVLRKKYEQEIGAAREKEEAAKSAAAAALEEKAELEKRAAEIQAKAEAAALAASQAKAVEAAVLAAARKGNVLPDEEKQKIMESVRLARLPKEAAPVEQPKPSLKKKPAFSFLGRAAPSSTTTETEPAKEAEEEKDAESKVKDKADKKAVADKKQEEEKLKKEQDAKKLAEARKKEEQERLEKEAKERVVKEAAEAKQKEEAEVKRKEEELAEAKKKEEEEKEKKEAEAKKKEEEEIAKKEAKAKIKEEEERAKKEAEAKRKEEELIEAKKEEEEKAKKEAEMLKAQEEQKAKALAEEEAAKQAAISAAADEEAKEEKPKEAESPPPRLKGFRWFWQPADPETPDAEESTKEEVADVPVEAKIADQLPPCPTPLSPYARYPGLKPPAPPIASPAAPKPEKAAPPKADPVSSEIKGVDQATTNVELPSQEESAVLTKAPSKDLQDDIEARTQIIQETAAREREALEKVQATISFTWPWQNAEETTVEESASALKEEEPALALKEEEPASSVKEQEAVSPAITSQDKTNTLPPSSRPLSPYAQFPNLKPPSPPKPSSAPQNSSATNSKPAETLASSLNPLSPYPGFPDLKPPISPTPGGNGAVPALEAKEEEKVPEPAAESGFKWPWQQ